MIENRLKKCCEDCNHIDVSSDTDRLYVADRVYNAHVSIYCEHEKVCSRYNDKQSEENKEN